MGVKMQLKAVIFDLDGTIADTIKLTLYSIREYIRIKTGKQYTDEDILAEFGPIDTYIIRKFIPDNTGENFISDYVKLVSDCFDKMVKPIEGISEMLSFIKNKGIKTALFTGRSRITAELVLEKLGIKQYFDNIMAGDDTSKFKPNPEGIIKSLAVLGVNPEECAYVGDFDVDIHASRNAGTMAILALWSATANKELIKLNPDAAFETPYELINWIQDNTKL